VAVNNVELYTEEQLLEKLTRENGLCTSICRNGEQNAQIIKFIIDMSFKTSLQRSCRSSDDWTYASGCPMDFATYRYRQFQ
jgi:hypothetical protein